MKKSFSTQQQILRSIEAKRFLRRLIHKAKKLEKNRRISNYQEANKKIYSPKRRKWKSSDPWTDIPVPTQLDLEKNHLETCEFIKAVRQLVRNGTRLRLLFNGSKSIKLSALVLLLAQIHKLRIEFGQNHITGSYPENPRIERLLSDSGFYKLLEVKSRKNNTIPSKFSRFIRFKTDQIPNSSEIPNLRNELLGDDLRMPVPIKRTIFRALSEAMTNVNHHAYKTKKSHVTLLNGRWWMVANISERTKLFTLAFYDAGAGIPKTLPRKYTIEKIRGVLSILPGIQPDDAQMIKAAMELGRTSTNETNRGKGLLDLAKLIDIAGIGEMHIYSRNGTYKYVPGSESHANQDGFVEGTLIEWQLPINIALENLPKEITDELTYQD